MPGIIKTKLFIMPLDEDVPAHWDAMPANTSSLPVTINPGMPEHTEVQNLFKATCQQAIIKVDYIKHALYVMNNVLAGTSSFRWH